MRADVTDAGNHGSRGSSTWASELARSVDLFELELRRGLEQVTEVGPRCVVAHDLGPDVDLPRAAARPAATPRRTRPPTRGSAGSSASVAAISNQSSASSSRSRERNERARSKASLPDGRDATSLTHASPIGIHAAVALRAREARPDIGPLAQVPRCVADHVLVTTGGAGTFRQSRARRVEERGG